MLVVVAAVVALVSFTVVELVAAALLAVISVPELFALPIALWVAFVAARAVLRAQHGVSEVAMRRAVSCGLKVGTIGLLLGFFGPMILDPSANQGPMLGLFITGPIGFVLGAVGGWLAARGEGLRTPPPLR